MSFDDIKDMDNVTYDIDSFQESVRLKPDFYIHLTLQQLTKVFEGETTEVDGFTKYNHLVGHVEVIVEAANMLPKNYDSDVEAAREAAKDKKLGGVEADAFVARKKLGLIIGSVFSNAPARGALYLYDNVDGSSSRQNEQYKKSLADKKV